MLRKSIPFLALAALTVGCGGSDSSLPVTTPRGQLITFKKFDTLTVAEQDFLFERGGFPLKAAREVDYYTFTYQTIDAKGAPTVASGAVAVGKGTTSAPLLAFQHSTQTSSKSVPSKGGENALVDQSGLEPVVMASLFAGVSKSTDALAPVVVMADYLGLGVQPPVHPYIHANSEATAGLDAMRAAKSLVSKVGVTITPKTYVTGYSQGAHSAMALTRLIQNSASTEFDMVAAAFGSGPYDLSDTQAKFSSGQTEGFAPLFLAYALLGYQGVYGDIYTNLTDVFLPAYASQVTGLYDGQHSLEQIQTALGGDPTKVFQPSMLAAAQSGDPNSKIIQRLQENDVYNWRPNIPLRLYYGSADITVSPQNSVKAAQVMSALGADVQAIDLGATDHFQTFGPAMLAIRQYFIGQTAD